MKWILIVPDLGLVNENQCLDFFTDTYFQTLTFCPPSKSFLFKLGSPLVQTRFFIYVEFRSYASVSRLLYFNFELAEVTYFVNFSMQQLLWICSLVTGELKGVIVQVEPDVFMCTQWYCLRLRCFSYIGWKESRKDKDNMFFLHRLCGECYMFFCLGIKSSQAFDEHSVYLVVL